jgi:uncharacterized protein Yka (UPF0111/DUF47 family)
MSMDVYETDLGHYLNLNGKFKNLEFKKGTIMVTIEIENVSKLADNNAWLVQKTQDVSFPIVKKAAVDLIKDLAKLDEKKLKADDPAVVKVITAFNIELSKKLIIAAKGVFGSFAKDDKDYTIYKIKNGFKIGIKIVALAVSVGVTAAGGWSGVGTVVGIVGMVRSAASLAQQIANLSKESLDIFKRMVGNIIKLKQQLASPNLKKNTAQQIGATVLNKVFAVEIETLFVTLDGIESDFELMSNKVKGNKVKAVTLSGNITKLLDKQEDINKELAKLGAQVKSTGKGKDKLAKMLETQKKVEKETDELLTKVVSLSEGMNTIEAWTGTYHKQIKELKAKFNPTAVKAAGVATDLLLAVGSFVAGDFSSPGQTIKELHETSTKLVTALGIANDGFGALQDSGTAVYSAAA